jgi:hypothetical protein
MFSRISKKIVVNAKTNKKDLGLKAKTMDLLCARTNFGEGVIPSQQARSQDL